MSEWQLIETAPKNGRMILGFGWRDDAPDPERRNYTIRIIDWDSTDESLPIGVTSHWSGWPRFQDPPTHWMPLPEPPKDAE